ncbi:hypothetical protein ALQ79_200683 [Pseudomonas amygdali pv. lachrymans]|nr:hypothetical protein ALQ79_200683 [Pseudomonas amygdali pv. lachrymans]
MSKWEAVLWILIVSAAVLTCIFLPCAPAAIKRWRRTRFLISQIPEQEKRWHPTSGANDEGPKDKPKGPRKYPY